MEEEGELEIDEEMGEDEYSEESEEEAPKLVPIKARSKTPQPRAAHHVEDSSDMYKSDTPSESSGFSSRPTNPRRASTSISNRARLR